MKKKIYRDENMTEKNVVKGIKEEMIEETANHFDKFDICERPT